MSSPVAAPGIIPGTTGIFTESRIGTVVLATPNSMFVNVGGTTIEVAFLRPFLATAVTPPAAGTLVHLIRQDSTWVAQGVIIGAGSNAILNPSFELSAPGAAPAQWQSADVSGVSVATVVDVVQAPEGDYAVMVYSGQASVHYLYSNPIPVTVGDVWSLSAFVGGEYAGGPETADAALVALWFANATNLYPTTSSADIVVATSADVPQQPPYRTISGTVTAPVTGFMRVALRSTLGADQALVWDSVIARKV